MPYSNDTLIGLKKLTAEPGYSQTGFPVVCYGSQEDLLALLRMGML